VPASEAPGWTERLELAMSDCIPFANSGRDFQILNRYFSECQIVRTTGEALAKASKLLTNHKVWADAGVDGLDQWPKVSDSFREHISNWANVDRIVDPDFQSKPDKSKVIEFANSVLDSLLPANPQWISIPQLSCVTDASRNKVNRQLASASAAWQQRNRFKGRLILPFIVTHISQIRMKQERNKKVELFRDCLEESGAKTVWIVDRSLNDQDGAASVKEFRLKSIIELHQQVREKISSDFTVVAGPYWGLNLILWARGLVQHPAIGLGNAFQYHSPGGVLMAGKSRIAIGPLKRLAVASAHLKVWLEETLETISKLDPAHSEIGSLLRSFSHLQVEGRSQVAGFYSQWVARLEQLPPAGRSLALYQDFSSAYVLGRTLGTLPQDEGSARRPERVAEQLMLYCL
jgi:hypothetical protein